ncbi:hypothetical protein [Reinekea sp.]|uniref:hypothetical protein n=1 Tax=Reinekea sp. TaxID=1970455 RepID=UPI002A8386C3|nr:hypothetical protein [Reinekea sp.]
MGFRRYPDRFHSDTRYDIAAGRHHDLTSLGVLWGYSDPSALSAGGGHQCIAAPEDLLEAVKGSMLACY